ncbi:MAG: hypothetical protein IPM06_22630, partial [Rhizobiales bacterium]|nr:hypothetical protein [Hyphomicrobiales bacterium]
YSPTKASGDFLTVQCDICGECLPAALIPDEVFDGWMWDGVKYPRLDYQAYCRATDASIRRCFDVGTAELALFTGMIAHG